MKYTLAAVTCYLVPLWAYYPYSDGPNAAAEAAGVGLIRPLVVFEFVAEKVTGYYGDVSHCVRARLAAGPRICRRTREAWAPCPAVAASSRRRPLLRLTCRHSHAGERLRVVQDSYERRLYSIEEANWEAISERDVFDIAAIFIREHGPRAARQAGEWADLMLDRGDRSGHATWRQILWAIEELRHRSLREAEKETQAGRPCSHVPRLYSGVDTSLERVIREALTTARDTGQDDLAQTEQALRAARHARPALSLPDALSAVEMARRR